MKELNKNVRKIIINLIIACVVFLIVLITTIGALKMYFGEISDKSSEIAHVDSTEFVEEKRESIDEICKVSNSDNDEEFSDVDLLAHLIKMELNGNMTTPERAKRVGAVVLNRLHSEFYRDNLIEVIFDNGQFLCFFHVDEFYYPFSEEEANYYNNISQELIETSETTEWKNYCKQLKITPNTWSYCFDGLTLGRSVDEIVYDITKNSNQFCNPSLIVIDYVNNTVETYFDLKPKNNDDLPKPQIEIISRD